MDRKCFFITFRIAFLLANLPLLGLAKSSWQQNFPSKVTLSPSLVEQKHRSKALMPSGERKITQSHSSHSYTIAKAPFVFSIIILLSTVAFIAWRKYSQKSNPTNPNTPPLSKCSSTLPPEVIDPTKTDHLSDPSTSEEKEVLSEEDTLEGTPVPILKPLFVDTDSGAKEAFKEDNKKLEIAMKNISPSHFVNIVSLPSNESQTSIKQKQSDQSNIKKKKNTISSTIPLFLYTESEATKACKEENKRIRENLKRIKNTDTTS